MGILSLFGQASSDQHGPYVTYGTDPVTLSDEQQIAVLAGVVIFLIIATLIIYLITAWSLGRIFKKAGVESWKAWVPVYNIWNVLELGGQKGYWAVLALLPVIDIAAGIFLLIAMYKIGLRFGKPDAFIMLGIFLPLVWYIWLAVDGSKWQGTAVKAAQPVAPSKPRAHKKQPKA